MAVDEIEASREFPSPFVIAERSREAFFASYTTGCACSPIELREESTGLECASCGKRLRART